MTTLSKRFVAEVPSVRRQEGIVWLVLEDDTTKTGGWFLYGHQGLSEPCEFDYWYLTKGEAERHAEHDWGVAAEDWRPTP